jgi:hypothetical protein
MIENRRATMNCPSYLKRGATTHLALTVISLLAFFLAGCGGEQEAIGTFSIRDSLGIRIIENDPGVAAAAIGWRVDPEPALIIGSEESPKQALSNPLRPVRLEDGRILFAHLAGPELRIYDARGNLSAIVGGPGEGPGEFRAVGAPSVLGGDSILVWDQNLHRGSVFGSEGHFIRTFTLPEHLYPFRVLAAFRDGTLLVERGIPDFPSHLPYATTILSFFSRAGEERANLGPLPVNACGSPSRCTVTWFGPIAVRRVHGDRFYYGYPDRYEIRVFRKSGELDGIIRSAADRIPITPASLEAYKAYILHQDPAQSPERVEDRFGAQPIPEHMPAFRDFLIDASGHLWVREFSGVEPIFHEFSRIPFPFPDAPTPWAIFDEGGVYIGTLRLPSRLSVTDIGADYVLGVFTDELGVQTVRMYTLHR